MSLKCCQVHYPQAFRVGRRCEEFIGGRSGHVDGEHRAPQMCRLPPQGVCFGVCLDSGVHISVKCRSWAASGVLGQLPEYSVGD
eukprot:CAMPEP_0181325772 /NCGR_PEP_ID=MMETSP1101-20121128/21120_1 /TAXON_ID=46948 /ORGANISM="Rhodomonas abbreviata, Strain Caron Lab Isolate" /LENGTH=83 /DNA_ID=CAMNT_0023434135 /DNA_START=241 /DNA_END=492 /DNA_ORIENTATION=-